MGGIYVLLSEMLRLGTVMCKDPTFHVMNMVCDNDGHHVKGTD